MPRPTRLERWTLIAVLAAAMVYAVRSFVMPTTPAERTVKPVQPSAVSVVFLPAPAKPETRQPLPEPAASPLQPHEARAEPLPEPPVVMRPAPAPAVEPAVAPLVPATPPKPAAPAKLLRTADTPPLPANAPVAPMAPGKSPDPRSATAGPVPLRPRPPPQAAPEPVAPAVPDAPATELPKIAAARPAASDPGPRTDELVAGEGRALLRILEHGSGPTIDIAWPAASGERERLYHHLKNCFGMRPALMDASGRLYAAEGRPGEPWAINLDRHSGFVRQARGQVTADERQDIRSITAHHAGLAQAAPVRVFPRAVDALLLGHLRHAVGDDYTQARVIRAAYRFSGSGVAVESIEVDGRRIAGRIDLAAAASRGCRVGVAS